MNTPAYCIKIVGPSTGRLPKWLRDLVALRDGYVIALPNGMASMTIDVATRPLTQNEVAVIKDETGRDLSSISRPRRPPTVQAFTDECYYLSNPLLTKMLVDRIPIRPWTERENALHRQLAQAKIMSEQYKLTVALCNEFVAEDARLQDKKWRGKPQWLRRLVSWLIS